MADNWRAIGSGEKSTPTKNEKNKNPANFYSMEVEKKDGCLPCHSCKPKSLRKRNKHRDQSTKINHRDIYALVSLITANEYNI